MKSAQHDTPATCVVAVLAVLLGVFIALRPVLAPSDRQREIRRIVALIDDRDTEALSVARAHHEREPEDPLATALVAEAAARQFKHDLARVFYDKLPHDRGSWELVGAMGLARVARATASMQDEEKHLRRALSVSPTLPEANHRLGHLLQIQGRVWESAEFFRMQVLRGKCRGDELLGLATTDRFFQSDEDMERRGLEKNPPELMALMSGARRDLFENRQSDAESKFRKVVAEFPECGEAQGRLGRILVDRKDDAGFLAWLAQLPEAAGNHPEVWFVKGLQARQFGQNIGAIHCFLRTLDLSANHLAAHSQVARCLEQAGHSAAARDFAERGELLARLEVSLNLLRLQPSDEAMRKVSAMLGQAGRYLEAAGWEHVRASLDMSEPPDEQASVWARFARADSLQNALGTTPLSRLKVRDFAAPVWPSVDSIPTNSSPVDTVGAEVVWRFHDDSDRVGLKFTYYEGTTEETRLLHIFNVVGGGVAAVDYDCDGWPDLYLPQANDWRVSAPQPNHVDRLFRNVQGERFIDVTLAARLNETGFSHGVTAADFDQDGFSDIHVCNLGHNCLLHNNGDGTFTDITDRSGIAGNEWSTSSVLADFSGDGLPDLYVANYSNLEETRERECSTADGRSMACTPDVLASEFDCLLLNQGDGTFRDISEAAGVRVSGGRGLGLIAWDFMGNGRLGLFVANDTSQNFMFVNEGSDAAGLPVFREAGIVQGVAFDNDGNAQASMGVAASDADGDGRIDLFVTNFFADSNTLYSQQAARSFDDITRSSGLRDPSFWMLGFGTQFADFDGDGWDDLVLTNGHVDQLASNGSGDRMRPQVYRNEHGRGFSEVLPASPGSFLTREFLGRGLATFDWNRDGRTDFAFSNLHAPLALVTNQTTPLARAIVLQLIGTESCREPTGALVRLRVAGRDQYRLLTAGDGYLASNQRTLRFAIPHGLKIEHVEVRWPSGNVDLIDEIEPEAVWGVVEGAGAVLKWDFKTIPVMPINE